MPSISQAVTDAPSTGAAAEAGSTGTSPAAPATRTAARTVSRSIERCASSRPKRELLWVPLIITLVTLGSLTCVQRALAQIGQLHATRKGPSSDAGEPAAHPKLDRRLAERADREDPHATASAIITLRPGAELPAEVTPYARTGRLRIIDGHVAD